MTSAWPFLSKIQTDLIWSELSASRLKRSMEIFLVGRDPLVGHVADDFVDLRDAAFDAFEHLERMLGDDVPGPVDLPVGDGLIVLIAEPGGINEQRGRQRDRCHKNAVQ